MVVRSSSIFSFFFFNDTATTEIYTLSLHDALPISIAEAPRAIFDVFALYCRIASHHVRACSPGILNLLRSEEHTSELQSPDHLVCRLLLEKKKKKRINRANTASY